jgi:hypothetical protein
MTTTVLAWQALIFLSIGVAGRWRGYVIAFWIVWTVLQVVALPLSVLQFGTILVAALLFRRRTPEPNQDTAQKNPSTRRSAVPQSLPSEGNRGNSAPPNPAPPAQTGDTNPIVSALAELKHASAEWVRRANFESAANKQIKTDGFSCELEERVMKEALARDHALTREIQSELSKDSVLGKLYHGYLAEQVPQEGTVAERQIHEQVALEIARRELAHFEMLIEGGPDLRRAYISIPKDKIDAIKAAIADASAGQVTPTTIGPSDPDAHLMVLGRHINEWLDEVEASRRR